MHKKLYRSKKNEKICGVCSGIAEYFDIDPTIIRLIWAIAILFGGSGVLLYIVCAFIIPEKPDDDFETVE